MEKITITGEQFLRICEELEKKGLSPVTLGSSDFQKKDYMEKVKLLSILIEENKITISRTQIL